MAEIQHRVGAENTSPEAAFAALTTLEGLSGWWARDTTGDPEEGGIIAFRFVPGGFDMKVVETVSPKLVRWEVMDGPPEWLGTEIRFDIHQDGDHTIVLFGHHDWAEPGEFMAHCSTKWATYLVSLKELLETGTGRPDPDDIKISNWH